MAERTSWIQDDRPQETGFQLSGAERQRSARLTFGQFGTVENKQPGETLAIDPEEMERRLAGSDMHPSMRYSIGDSGLRFGSLEDKILILAVVAVFSILFLVALWFFLG